jgi:hypothetical protein
MLPSPSCGARGSSSIAKAAPNSPPISNRGRTKFRGPPQLPMPIRKNRLYLLARFVTKPIPRPYTYGALHGCPVTNDR